MSTTLSLQGVRGGVGVTTMVVALGHALHAQGERVLLVECSPDHLAWPAPGPAHGRNTGLGAGLAG